MAPKGQYFRANVGLLILGPLGKILVLERIDVPDAWQLPQGGIDVGEEPIDSALRELTEETGIDSSVVELVAEYPHWLTYELPVDARSEKTGRGQVQRWFIFRFIGTDEDINLTQVSQEFSQYKWVESGEVVKLAVDFRRETYSKIVGFLREQEIA